MKSLSKIGPMHLLEVLRCVAHTSSYPAMDLYTIYFGDGAKLAVTDLHAFKLAGTIIATRVPSQLKSGDQIWVDVSAFSADGSLLLLSSNSKTRR